MKNRPYSCIYTAVLVLVGISIALTGSVAGQSTGYVDVAASDLSGSGTAADPYVITNASELQAIEDSLSAYYELGENIDATGTAEWNTGNGFVPIGSSPDEPEPRFEGSLDGNNNSIIGLTINRSSEDSVGLLGATSSGAKIKNLSLQNITISGSRDVAGLVGNNYEANIQNVEVSGNITGLDNIGGLVGIHDGTIETATASANVSGSGSVGGLVGDNNGYIQSATASGSVTGTEEVGGLIGQNSGMVVDTFAVGVVSGSSKVGGLVGNHRPASADGVIDNSYWDKEATQQSTSAGDPTGLMTAEMTGESARINMSGLAFGTVWQPKPNDYPVIALQTNNSRQVDVDANALDGDGSQSDPYVITNVSELQAMEDDLQANYTLGKDIDASNTAHWNSRSGFDPIGTDNKFRGTLDGANHTITGLTVKRITQSRVGIISSAGKDTIVKDATVKNVTVVGSEYVGGIVGLNRRGKIQNVTVSGSITGLDRVGTLAGENAEESTIQYSTTTGTVTGSDSVGGLVGSNLGTLLNVTAKSTVSGRLSVGGLAGLNGEIIQNATATGNVTGEEEVGGLVGDNIVFDDDSIGSIQAVKATGSVSGSEQIGGLVGWNDENASIQYATVTGSVNGSRSVGGLVGVNDKNSNIRNTTASGSVTGSDGVGGLAGVNSGHINDSFAVGAVSGPTEVGGLIGLNVGNTKDSYWDIQSTGQSTSAGGATGLTTAQMTGKAAQTNMSGLTFGTTWRTRSGDYPKQIVPLSLSSPRQNVLSPIVGDNQPTDPDGDGKFEDINGDGKTNFDDAVALAFVNSRGLSDSQLNAIDFDNDGDIDFDDAVELAFST